MTTRVNDRMNDGQVLCLILIGGLLILIRATDRFGGE